MHLPRIQEFLENPKMKRIRAIQQKEFISTIKNVNLENAHALSCSCGDGTWDFLLLSEKIGINQITGTDVVPNPVHKDDIELLKGAGKWQFLKVATSGILPFSDNEFDVIYHMDVIEHTTRPYEFLSEQYRVLKPGGLIIVGTPNIFRPVNILKLLTGKLNFPLKIGHIYEIGDYVHVQEFHKEQLNLLLCEVGFSKIKIKCLYLGIPFLNLNIKNIPVSLLGQGMCHFLLAVGEKPINRY